MPVAEFVYEPREKFIPFHNRSQRQACIVIHRQAGKTVSIVNDLIIGCLECRLSSPRFAYVAPFRDQAKRVAWDYLKFYSVPFQAGRPNESELTVPLPNNGRISLFGADNADALRGLYHDGVALDEYGDFKPSVYGNVIQPTLAARNGWLVIAGTPRGRNEFWHVREKARRNRQDWYFQELRASESGLLSQSFLDKAREQLSPEQYAQEYECDFAAAIPGAYYGRELVAAEREGRIREVAYDKNLPVFTAWDIGYRDDTAIWFYQVLRGEIHLIDFHASSGQPIGYYVQLIKDRGYRYERHWLPHDARAKTLAAGGRSVIEQMAEGLGIHALAIAPWLDVQDGIQAVRLALKRCWFDEKKCYEGIEALRQYQREWDDEKKSFRERPRHDWTSHPADAFRMLALAWRAEAKEPEPEPVRALAVGPANTATMADLWKDHDEQSGRRQRI